MTTKEQVQELTKKGFKKSPEDHTLENYCELLQSMISITAMMGLYRVNVVIPPEWWIVIKSDLLNSGFDVRAIDREVIEVEISWL